LHKGLQIRDDDDEEKTDFSDTLSKVVGNVTNDLTCTFEYSVKSYEDLKVLDFDKLENLPFQVQIYYRDLNGKNKTKKKKKLFLLTYSFFFFRIKES
jgi:galactose-1-phosphate uridylyltransferase